MSELCKNCGLELFTAQRFCRSCGTPTEQLSEEQIPTRMMPPPPDAWGARSSASTAPTSRPHTSPVYDSAPGYQPSVPPMYPAVPPYVPPRKRTPLGWILAFIGMGLFVLVVVAVMMIARMNRNSGGGRGGPPPTAAARAGETLFDESTADQVVSLGNETTLTKVFTLSENARLSLKNVNGNITVSGWDEPKAEVKVIRRGASGNSQVFFNNAGGNLSIRTAQTRGNQDLRFEIKLPREVLRLEVSSSNGGIKLSDVRAEILADSTNGPIELTDVVGVSKVRTTNGSIKASLLEASDRGMEFESTNGTIDITVPSGFEADLDASTVHGSINLDSGFDVQVEKGIASQKARGPLGRGGERLRIGTTNGEIRLTTSEDRATGNARETPKGNAKGNTKGKENGN